MHNLKSVYKLRRHIENQAWIELFLLYYIFIKIHFIFWHHDEASNNLIIRGSGFFIKVIEDDDAVVDKAGDKISFARVSFFLHNFLNLFQILYLDCQDFIGFTKFYDHHLIT